MKGLVVVLVSGGMDSCVTAAIASRKYELAFMHVNYGQRTWSKELDSFNNIADFYKVEKRLICDFNWLKQIGGTSLLDPSYSVLNQQIPPTYVPFRNANLLCPAVAWAEVIGAHKIFIGAVEQDAPHYPDTRPEFYRTFNALIEIGTKPNTKIQVIAPLIGMQKSEIIKLGVKLNAPLHLSWSCYENNDFACGECGSCRNRLKAFEIAGLKDPINYKNA